MVIGVASAFQFGSLDGLNGEPVRPTDISNFSGAPLEFSKGNVLPIGKGSIVYDGHMGMPLLFGGAAATPVGDLNDTWAWDGHTWSQLHPATSPPARSDACLVYDAAAGQLVLFGGEAAATQLSDTWPWNGTTWTEQSAMPAPTGGYNSAAYDAAHHYILAYEQSETWIWMGTQWKKLD